MLSEPGNSVSSRCYGLETGSQLEMQVCTGVLVAAMAMLSACGWSTEQSEVIAAFDSLRTAVELGNWSETWTMLNSGSQGYLDSAAVELTELGLPSYGSGADLLRMTFHRFFSLEGEVTMVIIQASEAEVMLRTPFDRSISMDMIREETGWRLDIRQAYTDSIRGVFAGSYVSAGSLSETPSNTTISK